MDIATMSTLASHAQVKQQTSVQLQQQTMEYAQQEGEALEKMMNDAVNTQKVEHEAQPHLGGNVDFSA
ncbi:putative motility protein [Salisediminibacterium halotolerans]|uniref:Motility protein n=1 Tax=Salisediminibacterium halotolerans TaxID=517425 RepID=A0A1H9VJY9_9BACI|nr:MULTISPECIES: putative motility protein [Salisediminibacterium]RLJ75515.1 putative motility protein YjfB-like [Actinophytocola xinjiangensis]RPE89368.1 putative motility protein YjfB-like [Salisediminibacterium halotolerans]TWG36128.1 putative motility protein YjfB-like [Salisediminibacterium halotolerans]SES21657.1 Putative motility protein [Salisediminibacterium haloalkalitolerans]GEL08130.1 hypothetical protein SHA02_15460 [Salisediminibacterium halotolerans]